VSLSRRFSLVSVVLLCLVPRLAAAAVAQGCAERTPRAITAPSSAGLDCQRAIAKEGAKFVKAKTSALSKCLLKSAAGACPDTQTTTKVEQAAQKAAEKIANACADDAAQAGLGSSYAALTDEAQIGSCMLSQHNATADLLVGNATGVSTEPLPAGALPAGFPDADNKARKKCISQANKTGVSYALGVLSAVGKCLDKRLKDAVTADLEETCVGSYDGTGFVAPTDPKTAGKLTSLRDGALAKLDKKCSSGVGTWLPSVFACGGAESVAELQDCLLCQGWNDAVDLVEQQYAENGSFVAHAAGAVQDAVDAAATGAKLLIQSGDYEESVVIDTDGLQLVGCGGATGDRPRFVRPAGGGSRGIQALLVDDLWFQSLDMVNWDDDGIFVSGDESTLTFANNAHFRDIVGDGMRNTTYIVFPKVIHGVVVEGCSTKNVADAAIYVGQSSDIVVRHSRVEGSVAGIEIENSARATVQNNYAAGNTGGMLVFKAEGLMVQDANDHVISHNVLEDNNEPNYGQGTVSGIPDGTGLLIISTDDSVYEHNVIRGNNTFGIALIDQLAASQAPQSPDQKTERNVVRRNVLTGNAAAPDAAPAGDLVFAIYEFGDPADHGNCIEENVTATDPFFFVQPQCSPLP
jgi:parallel beta-helix repeat protein